MRNVIVFVSDHELAEIAAVGIRLAAGWNAEIVHDIKSLPVALKSGAVYAIFSVALQPGMNMLLDTRDLLRIAKAHATPVVMLTPEPYFYEELRNFDVLPVCNAFDPLLLSSLIDEAVSSSPLFASAAANACRTDA